LIAVKDVKGLLKAQSARSAAFKRKWQNEICNFATLVKVQIKNEEIKMNPLKASKKGAGKK